MANFEWFVMDITRKGTFKKFVNTVCLSVVSGIPVNAVHSHSNSHVGVIGSDASWE